VSIYLERHAQSLLSSLGRIARAPFAAGLTIVVIGIALALPAALYVVVVNLGAATAGLDETIQLSVYLEMPTSEAEAKKAATDIAARNGVKEAQVVSPQEGLAEFRALSGMGDALQALPQNPLPWLIRVRPSRPYDTVEAVQTLAADLAKAPHVELVEADTEWVRRLHAIQDGLEEFALLVAAALAAGVLAVVGNTIRLEINARRAEIEVTKLVGASDAFVRRPFLYSGLWLGLGGGLIAVAIIAAGLATLEPHVARVAAAYGSSFGLRGLSIREWPLVVAAGLGLGLVGAWIAAGYHLRRIEPRA
jgi:cell division transport system permease protein